MVTRGSFCWVIWEEGITGNRGMIERVDICDNEINSFLPMGTVVDKLAKLRGELEDMIRFVTVEISKKDKLSFRIFHLKEIIVHSNVIRENGFLARIRFGINSTDNQ